MARREVSVVDSSRIAIDVPESKTGARTARDSECQKNVGLRQGRWKNAQRAMGGVPSVKESTCV